MIKRVILFAATLALGSHIYAAASPFQIPSSPISISPSRNGAALIASTFVMQKALAAITEEGLLSVSAEDFTNWTAMLQLAESNQSMPHGFTPPRGMLIASPKSPSRTFVNNYKALASRVIILQFIDILPTGFDDTSVKSLFPNLRKILHPDLAFETDDSDFLRTSPGSEESESEENEDDSSYFSGGLVSSDDGWTLEKLDVKNVVTPERFVFPE